MTMNWPKIWDAIINKFHIVLGTICQGAIILYHFKTGKDLGPGVVSSVYAFYGFLLGHSGIYQKWPDKDSENGDDGK